MFIIFKFESFIPVFKGTMAIYRRKFWIALKENRILIASKYIQDPVNWMKTGLRKILHNSCFQDILVKGQCMNYTSSRKELKVTAVFYLFYGLQ